MIFISNKYTNWYNSIIDNAQRRTLPTNTYIEKHHIIPRSLGGTNEESNIVKLTAREHFICHLLLTKMTQGRNKHKMSKALTMIMSIKRVGKRQDYTANGRWYQHARELADTVRTEYWTEENRRLQSIRTTNYFALVDKTSEEFKRRCERSREYNLNKTWTEKAIATRLENCLKSAASRKGKKNPKHGEQIFANYVNKNIEIIEQIWDLYASGLNRRQISIKLGITWDRVNLAINKKQEIEIYYDKKIGRTF
jgi:hypothetical protein